MRRLFAVRPLRIATLLMIILLAGSISPGESDPANDYRSRLNGILSAQQDQLALLAERHAQARTDEESRRLQQEIDLVKRTAELRILEMRDSELRRLGNDASREQLLPLLERCRVELAERQLRYGIPLPDLAGPEE